LIVQDAAYNEVTFDEYQAPSILQVPGAKEVAIELHSFSKTFNMTGWRVGWAWGGRNHIEALSKVKSNVDSGTFMAIQQAAVVALANFNNHVPQMHAEYQRRNLLHMGTCAAQFRDERRVCPGPARAVQRAGHPGQRLWSNR